MRRLRRVTAFILITALLITTCLTALPKMCKEVHAEAAVKKIVLVNNGAAAGIQGAGESYLYFGNYKQTSNGNGGFNNEPIKWQVLANADNKLLLLSDMNLDCKQYHGVLEDVTWDTSDIRKWLNGLTPAPDTILYPNSFIGTAFSNNERDAIAVTYVIQQPNPWNLDVGANTFDKVFFLSYSEATNQAYGFATGAIGDMRRIAVNTAYAKAQGAYEYDGKGIYWLRTQFLDILKKAYYIMRTGVITPSDVNNTEVAVRPALNINLDSVVLVSSYNVGKLCGETGSVLTAVEDNGSNNSWKVTVKDSSRSGFIVKRIDSNEAAAGSTIRVRYQNAKYGDNEYVSAIITDTAGNVLYYGHIEACNKAYKAGGEADIVIPAGVPSGFKVYVFNEHCNENTKTDYASELKDVTNLDSSVQNPSLILVNNGSVASIQGGQASNVYFGNYLQTSNGQGGLNVDSIKWRVLENANNQLFLVSDALLDAHRFDDNSNDWLNSDIYSWLNGNEVGDFFKTAFAEKEQSAIVSSTDPGRIFLLSGDELQNPNYAFTDNGLRRALNTAYAIAQGASDSSGTNSWWLRTPGSDSGKVISVGYDGRTNMSGFDVNTDSYGVRPAFRIDLNSVVFASPAVGGKVSEFTGSVLNKVGDIGGNIDWKLTLKDPSRANFTATRIDYNDISAGTTIRIQYSNAKTGVNEYVSAIITDAAGKVIYYGNIDRSSSMRAVNIEIPEDVPSGFKVYVFSEQCNGDRKTDYASNLIDVTNTGVTPPKMINFVVQHSYAVDADNIIGVLRKPTSVMKALSASFTGVSNVTAVEILVRASIDPDRITDSLSDIEKVHILHTFNNYFDDVNSGAFTPIIYFDGNKPCEYACFPYESLNTYGKKEYSSVSVMLEDFYLEKEKYLRNRQKSSELRALVTQALERNVKKLDLQTKQLKDTETRDKYKIYGEMLHTYGYNVAPGTKEFTCVNYYTNEDITIPLDNTKTVMENAAKFFERYNKLKRTKEALDLQIEDTKNDIEYLDSVLSCLDLAENEDDLKAIKEELTKEGYIRKHSQGKKDKYKSSPLHYVTDEGFEIYIGKNNTQNDELTFKFAQNNDYWFHAKKIPGSHVILATNGKEPTDQAYMDAAAAAAYYSKGRDNDKVEVDYLIKSKVKKPNGAKPGFVVYYTNYSMTITPSLEHLTLIKD